MDNSPTTPPEEMGGDGRPTVREFPTLEDLILSKSFF